MKGGALAFIACVGLMMTIAPNAGLAAEPTEPRAGVPPPVVWVCETHAVVVAPEAASSKGKFKLRTTAETPEAGSWAVFDRDAIHSGSFAARHGDCESGGCAYTLAANATRYELWAPRKVAPALLPKGDPLTVATLDLTTGRLRASSFIDNAIAALEQGTCKVGE